jgi:hypothetical protein
LSGEEREILRGKREVLRGKSITVGNSYTVLVGGSWNCVNLDLTLIIITSSVKHSPPKSSPPNLPGLTGKTSVPQGFLRGIHIGGCNDGTQWWHGIVPLAQNGMIKKAIECEGEREEILKVLQGR